MTEPKVRVKLSGDCIVDGVVRYAGEIVEIEQSLVDDFGVAVDSAGRTRTAKAQRPEGKDDDDK